MKKTDPLTYNRVPFEKYKDVTPKTYKFAQHGQDYKLGQNNATDSSKLPKGTVLGTPFAPVDSTRKDIMR